MLMNTMRNIGVINTIHVWRDDILYIDALNVRNNRNDSINNIKQTEINRVHINNENSIWIDVVGIHEIEIIRLVEIHIMVMIHVI